MCVDKRPGQFYFTCVPQTLRYSKTVGLRTLCVIQLTRWPSDLIVIGSGAHQLPKPVAAASPSCVMRDSECRNTASLYNSRRSKRVCSFNSNTRYITDAHCNHFMRLFCASFKIIVHFKPHTSVPGSIWSVFTNRLYSVKGSSPESFVFGSHCSYLRLRWVDTPNSYSSSVSP